MMLQRALQLSPDYAPAWSHMGLLHFREKELATTVEDRQKAIQQAREALTKALELDPDLALAHSRMAGVYRDSWEFDAAERSTERALAADPKNPIVLGNAANLYSYLGKRDEATRLFRAICGPRPAKRQRSHKPRGQISTVWPTRRGRGAVPKIDRAAARSPLAYMVIGEIQLRRGRPTEARAAYAKCTDLLGGSDYWRLSFEAMVEHTAGNVEASQRAAEEFERRFGAEDPTPCAEIRAWRGETDAAFAWLDKALAVRGPSLAQLKMFPNMNSLHADPRWNELLKKIGLPTD